MKNLQKKTFNEEIKVRVLQSDKKGATLWEIDALVWQNFNEYFSKTTDSLQQLGILLEKLNNIPVPSHIKDEVESARKLLFNSLSSLHGKNYQAALKYAQEGHRVAEKAFFDPHMIGMLYFPAEHKYAIYVPLFLPLTFPIVSGFMDWRAYKKNRN